MKDGHKDLLDSFDPKFKQFKKALKNHYWGNTLQSAVDPNLKILFDIAEINDNRYKIAFNEEYMKHYLRPSGYMIYKPPFEV